MRFKALLWNPRETRSVSELAFAVGFASDSHASRAFRQTFGLSPGRYRKELQVRADAPGPPGQLDGAPPFFSWVSALI
ncbi:helix-turn-helix domain-containing protein [Jiella sp. M17.18]|uniref:helix-turn-helix domain-containing protein n=1 Tax=Jiella sp. M17.18 TaxID=3234247 RepID=UPI0034DFF0A8